MIAREKSVCSTVFRAGAACALLMFSLFLLCSCGGGDDGAATSQAVTLSGTVAGGAPLQTFVTFRDGNGNRYSDITDTNGKYVNVNITAQGLTPPVLIRVQDPNTGVLYSYASKSGTANVHPLTDPIIRAWYRVTYPAGDLDEDFYDEDVVLDLPTQNEIDFIKAVVMDVLNNLLLAVSDNGYLSDADGNPVAVADFDPMETSFNADSSGFDKILDQTEIDTSEETGNLNIVVDDGSELEDDLEETGGSTSITLDTGNIVETDTTAPGKPATPSAAQVSNNQILVTWAMNDPNDGVAYYFVYQNGTKVGSVTSTAFIKPIDPNTPQTYTYTIAASDAAGNRSVTSNQSNAVTIAALATDTGPPTAGTLYATALGFDEIKLTWTGFSDDVAIVRFRVYSCTDGTYATRTLITKVPGQPFIHFGRQANTTYYYVVTAIDAEGNESAFTATASATTGAATVDTIPPAIPTGFSAAATAYNQINLSWTASPDADLAGYYIYRGGVELAMLSKTAISYSNVNLQAETTYTYWIKAFDIKGNISNIATTQATTPEAPDLTPPSVPSGVMADANSANEIIVTWTASTDAQSGVAGYYVYRGGVKVATVTSGISYTDSGLNPLTTYTYQVSAYDNAGNESAKSSTASETTPAGPPPDVSGLINDAKACIEAQDIPGANAKFKSAIALDPNHKDANFGVAITDGIMLLEDPDLISFFNTYETYKPTIENIVYGMLYNTYEVWGGSNALCDNESLKPGAYGYTKLSDPNTPVTSFSGYNYYVIYATPFSEVDMTLTGTGIYIECSNGEWEWTAGGTDTISVTLGGESLFGSALTISAPSGMTLSTPDGVQKKMRMKSLSSSTVTAGDNNGYEIPFAGELTSLLNKLPKNKRSVRTRMKILARSLAEGPPSPADVQALIDLSILPTINGMIANLRKVEGTGYEFTITPEMTGGAETVNTVLDDGEFYALDAMLSVLKCMMNIMTAYNLNVDFAIMEYDPLSQISNASFFTLKADGATRMNNALTALRDAVTKAENAYDFVYTEWGYSATNFTDGMSQTCQVLAPTITVTDNGLELHNYDPDRLCEDGGPYDFTPDDDGEIKKLFDAANLVLAGQVTYTEEIATGLYKEYITNGTTTVTLKSEVVAEPDEVMFSLTLNATKFFTSPLSRADLPTFGYDVPINLTLSQTVGEPVNSRVDAGYDTIVGTEDDHYLHCEMWETSVFPDLTFNGIFPGGFPEFSAMLYLDNTKTIIMPKEVLWGWYDSGDLEVMADGNFSLLKSIFDTSSESKIFTIHPTNGSILATREAIPTSPPDPNTANFIQGHAYHSGVHWAAGGYMDGSSNWKMGVFILTISGTEPQVSNAIPFTFSNTNDMGIGDLASDGTNLYLGIAYWDASNNRKSVVVKFNPSTTTQINESTPVLFDMSDENYWAAWKLTYGGGYLWVGGYGLWKLNPSTGAVVKEYEGDSSAANLYYNSRLVSVEGMKLLFFVAP